MCFQGEPRPPAHLIAPSPSCSGEVCFFCQAQNLSPRRAQCPGLRLTPTGWSVHQMGPWGQLVPCSRCQDPVPLSSARSAGERERARAAAGRQRISISAPHALWRLGAHTCCSSQQLPKRLSSSNRDLPHRHFGAWKAELFSQ